MQRPMSGITTGFSSAVDGYGEPDEVRLAATGIMVRIAGSAHAGCQRQRPPKTGAEAGHQPPALSSAINRGVRATSHRPTKPATGAGLVHGAEPT